MADQLEALTVIFTEFYYWVTVVMMFLIHAGLLAYEFGATRPKNLNQTLVRHTMGLAVVTITWFLFGWWIYWAFNNGPFLVGGVISNEFTAAALPWSERMGPHLQDNHSGRLLGCLRTLLLGHGCHSLRHHDRARPHRGLLNSWPCSSAR